MNIFTKFFHIIYAYKNDVEVIKWNKWVLFDGLNELWM